MLRSRAASRTQMASRHVLVQCGYPLAGERAPALRAGFGNAPIKPISDCLNQPTGAWP